MAWAVGRWSSRSFEGAYLSLPTTELNIHRNLSVSILSHPDSLSQLLRKATHNHLSEVRNNVCLSFRKLAMPRGGTSHSFSLRIDLLIYIAVQFDLPSS